MANILSQLTWPEAKEAIAGASFAIVPVGAQEQHGPHVETSSDTVRAETMAAALSQRMQPHAVVTPTIPMGISAHHMGLPGTISLREETLISIIEDIAASLKRHGIPRLFLLNAHGGNQSALDVATERIRRQGVLAATCNYTVMAKDIIKNGVASDIYGHACERETSELLYLHPKSVRTELLQQIQTTIKFPHKYAELTATYPIKMPLEYDKISTLGYLGNPSAATREFGQAIIERCLERLCDFLDTFKDLPV